MLKPSLHSRAPRRGQALILAVLVMLFAVLLSSAFLVVIGNTGRQIGRETDRSEASRNADKAVSFVVAQMRSAANPDTYNPEQFAGALPTSTAERELYYSQLDKAMGWEAQNYVKFPNPLSSRQAPQFLVKSNLVTDDAEGGDKRFMLKITVIGLSSKNPETWSRRTLYKTTNWNGATFSYANFVTSFDPDTQKPISSALSAVVTASPTLGADLPLSIFSTKGQGNERVAYSPKIAEVGNTLMVSDGRNQPLVGVVKSSVFDPTASAYNLVVRVLQAGTATGNFEINSKVALVGTLFENTQTVDDDGNTATPEATTDPQSIIGVRNDIRAAMAPPLTEGRPLGNGAQFNNGLSAPITTIFAARKPEARNSTYAGQNFLASSGPVSIGNPTPAPPAAPVPPITINFAGVTTEMSAPIVQAAPSNNQFLSASFDEAGSPRFVGADSPVAPVIAPRSVRPAPIDIVSYRNKAKASGLYINNPDDVEKFNGQPLGTSQLQRLWQRKSFRVGAGGNTALFPVGVAPTTAVPAGAEYARLCYGRPGTDAYTYPMASGSLEQRGIRGWISPWEFLPRGAQVILTPTFVRVILDPISDNSSNLPDLNKSFDRATREFRLPLFNPATNGGVIYAEGNIRVSGTWSGPPLTIVSGNNIYIEGNLTTPVVAPATVPSRIALLGKKNVVLNPTQFVARPAGTVDTSVGKFALPGTEQSGAVQLASGSDTFKLGDKVAVFAASVKADGWHEVTAINGTTLTLAPALGSDFSGKAVKVKLACDPPIVLTQVATDSTSEYFEGKTTAAGQPDNDATITELPVTSANLTQPNTFWSYAFKTGGDTLARNVPFNAPIGVAMRESVAKNNVVLTVQGGQDPRDPADPTDDIDDDGNRNLESRTSATNPFELRLTPKSGAVTSPAPSPNYDVFDLKQLNDTTGSPNPDDISSILASLTATTPSLKKQLEDLSPSQTDTKTNRWRLVLPPPVSPAIPGIEDVLAARRLSQTSVSVALGRNPDGMAHPIDGIVNPINDETTPTQIRVPLTPSVVLFAGTLTTTAPDVAPLSRIGSTFGYQQTVADPTKETRFIKASELAKAPLWDQPAASGSPNVVKYTQSAITNDVAWTRDGAGDYNDQLPTYYVSGWRFQKVAQDAPVNPNPNNIPPTGNSVAAATNAPKTNMTVQVDATIYAEGGSWFVIPVPTPNANGAQPADPDQLIEWRRPAYQVTINGNIAQMMTPTATVDYDDEPDPDGVAVGAMKRWTDSLSYQVYDATTPTQPKWQTIRYQAAPLPAFTTNAMGNVVVDVNGNPVQAPLPQLPASTDILYTYSN